MRVKEMGQDNAYHLTCVGEQLSLFFSFQESTLPLVTIRKFLLGTWKSMQMLISDN